MALETAMASGMAIYPRNMVIQSRHKGLSIIASKPLTNTLPAAQRRVMLELRSLTINANQVDKLPSTSWSFTINSKVHHADRAESCKQILRAAMASCSDAEEGKNTQRLAKSNRPKMSRKERNPKRLSSSASPKLVLDYIQILKYPLITDLAMTEMIENNTLTFIVDKNADKENIKEAVKKMFKIQTRKVNTLMMPDGHKKAYIMLKPNHNAVEIAKKIKII